MQKKILREILISGLQAASLSLPPIVLEQILDYVELLSKWNKIHNLTAIRDPIDMIQKHVLDCLIVLKFLGEGRVLDVGTGAGLPGLLLALARPHQSFVLLDANQKKVTFVQHVILSLKLTNVVAVCARVEAFPEKAQFPIIISRAFSSLSDFARLAGPLCHPEGRLLAMKGVVEPHELSELSASYKVEKIEPLTLPGLPVARALVWITPQREA